MKKILLILCVTSYTFTQNILSIKDKQVDLNSFEVSQKLSLESLGVQKTIDDYLNLEMLRQYAYENELEKTSFYEVEYNNAIFKLKDSLFYPEKSKNRMINQEIERSKFDRKAQFIVLSTDLKSKETLENIKKEIISGKISFEDAAKKYSENYDVPKYYTILEGQSIFENLIYNTKIGEISDISQNEFYTIMCKVLSERSALGELLVSQIVIKGKNQGEKANIIKKELDSGLNFIDAVKKYSEDEISKKTNGMIAPITKAINDDELYNMFSKMKTYQISSPILVNNDYYIFKIDQKITYNKDNKNSKIELFKKIKNTDFINELNNSAVEELKNTQNYKLNNQIYDGLINAVKIRDSKKLKDFANQELCSINNFNLKTEPLLIEQLENMIKNTDKKLEIYSVTKSIVDSFIQNNLFLYYSNNFDKMPQMKFYSEQAKDEISLEYTLDFLIEKEVENPQKQKEYFEKNKSDFSFPERVDCIIYKCADDQTAQEIEKMIKNNKSENEIKNIFSGKTDEQGNLKLFIIKGKLLKQSEEFPETIKFKKGIHIEKQKGKTLVIKINEIEKPRLKTFEEAKYDIYPNLKSEIIGQKISEFKMKIKPVINQEAVNILKLKYK